MIYYFTPYDLNKNIGQAYNSYMRLIGDEDSACFLDGDTTFLTSDFGAIINRYATKYPDAVLTCRTNRIHALSRQLENGQIDEVCDMRALIKKAEARKHLTTVTEIYPGEGFSGLLMLVPKKIWNRVPFIEKGLLGVDSQFRMDLHKAGIKTLIMDAILVWHTYRLGTHYLDKSHLI